MAEIVLFNLNNRDLLLRCSPLTKLYNTTTTQPLHIGAMAGNRTRVNCLEGSYAHHYTNIACRKFCVNFIDIIIVFYLILSRSVDWLISIESCSNCSIVDKGRRKIDIVSLGLDEHARSGRIGRGGRLGRDRRGQGGVVGPLGQPQILQLLQDVQVGRRQLVGVPRGQVEEIVVSVLKKVEKLE